MATFNRVFIIIMGFALCSLTAASESCSVETGECDALDQAEDVQLSLLQKGIEHKVNAAQKHHKVVSHNGLHKRKDVKRNKVHVKVARRHVTWLGTCHGYGCPPAYSADEPCPSECEAYPGTTGDCVGTSEHNKTCPNTFDLSKNKPCPKGCTVIPDTTGNFFLDLIMMSSHKRKVHAKVTTRSAWLGTCHGEGCPPAYNATRPCPSECEAYAGTTGDCLGTSEHNKTCPNTFDLSKGKFCPKGCTVVPDTNGEEDLDFIMKSSHKRKVHAKEP
jgi:hypothetical protein